MVAGQLDMVGHCQIGPCSHRSGHVARSGCAALCGGEARFGRQVEAVVVTDGDEHVIKEEDKRVSAVELLAGIDDHGKDGEWGRGGSEEVEDDLDVGGGVEDGAMVFKQAAEGGVVDEVVGNDDGVKAVVGEEGLDVLEWGGGGVGG